MNCFSESKLPCCSKEAFRKTTAPSGGSEQNSKTKKLHFKHSLESRSGERQIVLAETKDKPLLN